MALSLWNDDFFNIAGFPFETGLTRGPRRNNDASGATRGIPLDIKETEKEFDIKADIPGVDKKDIKISLDGDVLNLSVQRDQAKEENKEENGVKWHRSERSSFFASRALRLPENANVEGIKAKYENGVLNLAIPKTEQQKPKTQQIGIE